MNEELKRCPFCGGKAVIYVDNGVRVRCTDCEITTVSLCDTLIRSKESAIEKVVGMWNRRVNDGKTD